MTTKKERLEAAIHGDVADRPPVALWRHFPVDDQDPVELSASTADFQKRYDFDFVKVTPASSFCIKDWGSMDRWEGSSEGTRAYSHRVIRELRDWRELQTLDPTAGYLADQIECLRLLRKELGQDTPIIQTIFSPLAQAKNLAGRDKLRRHLHRDPERVTEGLKVITESTVAFIQACVDVGVDGIFYAIQHASYDYLDRESYQRLAEADDLKILDAAADLWLNVLHLHGGNLMFEVAADYPAQVVNWHSQTEGPDLGVAQAEVQGAVCGGLRRHENLVLGDPSAVRVEAEQAMRATNGRGFILGAGCVTPIIAPAANIRAARRSVEDFV